MLLRIGQPVCNCEREQNSSSDAKATTCLMMVKCVMVISGDGVACLLVPHFFECYSEWDSLLAIMKDSRISASDANATTCLMMVKR